MRIALLLALTCPWFVHAQQEPIPGSLVIVGGGGLPDAVRDEFFKLAGGEGNAKIVVIPTASADADDPKQAESFLKRWKDLKAVSVVLLHTRDPKTADTEDFAKPIREATAIWFSGGDQRRIVEAYRGTATHKAMTALLHDRKGVIGGTSAGAAIMSDPMITGGTKEATTGAGLGFLPGVLCDQHFVARKRLDRLRFAVGKEPKVVGMGIDEATAAVVTGRTIRVVGASTVTMVWAKGTGEHGPAARELELKSGETADLFQVRRAALDRAAAANESFHKTSIPRVREGTLLIVGGGGLPNVILDRFFALAGGRDAPIVFVPTANSFEPIEKEPADLTILKKAGAKNITVLHTRDRKTADDPKFSESLTTAKAVWFAGGRQWRLVDSYAGTLTEKRFHAVLNRGGCIAGTSAGASIQSEFMPRGHPLGNTMILAEGYERGFGFLPGCAVDQHFFAQKRPADMTGLMTTYPNLLGIGIDEATAIVVTGSTAEVIGNSRVAFYDYSKGKPTGEIDYIEVKTGGKYDLAERRVK